MRLIHYKDQVGVPKRIQFSNGFKFAQFGQRLVKWTPFLRFNSDLGNSDAVGKLRKRSTNHSQMSNSTIWPLESSKWRLKLLVKQL